MKKLPIIIFFLLCGTGIYFKVKTREVNFKKLELQMSVNKNKVKLLKQKKFKRMVRIEKLGERIIDFHVYYDSLKQSPIILQRSIYASIRDSLILYGKEMSSLSNERIQDSLEVEILDLETDSIITILVNEYGVKRSDFEDKDDDLITL